MSTQTDSPQAPPFRCKRELPFLLIIFVVALAARWPMTPYAEMYWNSDGAITCLMAKHHWKGELPIFFYGQVYNGSIEAALAAPFYPLYGATVEGTAVSKTILMALLALVIYRLLYDFAGRGGAIAGTLPWCFGTRPLLMNLCRQHSYTMLLLIGLILLLYGLKVIREPTRKRCFLIGLLVGVGWFNNPMIVGYVAPLLVCLYLRGRTCQLIGSRTLWQTVGPNATKLKIWFGLLGLLIVAMILFSATGTKALWLGSLKIGVSKPYKYLQLLIMIIGATMVLLEFFLHADRKRWYVLGACFIAGFVIGDAPQFVFKIRNKINNVIPERGTPTGVDPSFIMMHLKNDLRYHGEPHLFNAPELHPPVLKKHPVINPRVYHLLRGVVMVIALLALLGYLVNQRENLWAMLRLRPPEVTLQLLLGMQAAVVLILFLCYPRPDMYPRYIQPFWPAFCALFAGFYVFVRNRLGGKRAIGVAAIWVVFYAYCSVYNYHRMKDHMEREPDWKGLRQVIAAIEKTDVRVGYCNFWFGYRITFLSDERIRLRPWPDIQPKLYMPYVEEVKAAKEVVWAINLADDRDLGALERFNARWRNKVYKVRREDRSVKNWLLIYCTRNW